MASGRKGACASCNQKCGAFCPIRQTRPAHCGPACCCLACCCLATVATSPRARPSRTPGLRSARAVTVQRARPWPWPRLLGSHLHVGIHIELAQGCVCIAMCSDTHTTPVVLICSGERARFTTFKAKVPCVTNAKEPSLHSQNLDERKCHPIFEEGRSFCAAPPREGSVHRRRRWYSRARIRPRPPCTGWLRGGTSACCRHPAAPPAAPPCSRAPARCRCGR